MTRAVSGAGRPQAEQYKGHSLKGSGLVLFSHDCLTISFLSLTGFVGTSHGSFRIFYVSR